MPQGGRLDETKQKEREGLLELGLALSSVYFAKNSRSKHDTVAHAAICQKGDDDTHINFFGRLPRLQTRGPKWQHRLIYAQGGMEIGRAHV